MDEVGGGAPFRFVFLRPRCSGRYQILAHRIQSMGFRLSDPQDPPLGFCRMPRITFALFAPVTGILQSIYAYIPSYGH